MHFVRFGRRAALWFLLVTGTGPALAQGIEAVDVRLFRSINNQQSVEHNGFFEYLDYTTLPTFAAIPVGFVIVGGVTRDRFVTETGILSALAQGTSLGVTIILKEIVDRPRPFAVMSDVRVKHRWSGGGSSFPSGHSSQAFSIATVFSLKYHTLGVTIPAFLWAVAVGYGRIYLGLHYPSDVLGGAAIGILSGAAIWSVRSHIEAAVHRSIPDEKRGILPVPHADLMCIQVPL